MASTPEVSNDRDYNMTTTAGDVIYIMSNSKLNIYVHENNKISPHLDLDLRLWSRRASLLRLSQFILNYMGFYYNFDDFYTNFYEVNNFYILGLIIALNVIILDLIVLLNADILKYYVVFFLILKLIFGRN